jgi:hypothetical protein
MGILLLPLILTKSGFLWESDRVSEIKWKIGPGFGIFTFKENDGLGA